jgi:hypothetical protein
VKCFLVRRQKNRVLREQSSGGSRIVVDVCIVSFFKERIKLLAYLWIDRLLGKARLIANPTRVSSECILIVPFSAKKRR